MIPALTTLTLLCGLADGTLSPQQSEPVFREVAGEREFSGWMIARPVQPPAATAVGAEAQETRGRAALGHRTMRAFDVIEYVAQTDEYVFRVPHEIGEEQLAAALMQTGGFEYVEPDWYLYPVGVPNDPRFGSQWHHQPNRMRSADGWDLHTGKPLGDGRYLRHRRAHHA